VLAGADRARYTLPMRLAALVLAIGLGLGAATAIAQPDPGGFGSPAAEPENMRQPEVLSGRPSGFWTSTRPSQGGAYRWRIMAAGIAVLGVSVFFLTRAIRRASRAAEADPRPWRGHRAGEATTTELPPARARRV